MKVPISWLERYCEAGLSTDDLADKLTMSGTEVEDIETVGGETVLTLEVTSNRPDLLGIMGVARELAALTGKGFKNPDVSFETSDADASSLASVTNEDEKLCSLYTAKVIQGVTVGESPEWLKDLITSVGLRPVNNVVDITNFIMYETGQPLHAFDLDKLGGERIVVRRARTGEKMTAIDGTTCELQRSDLIIADANKPVAIAGVMGGQDTEVGASTTNILLESAIFDPLSVRQTSRRLALASDSSYRFERGVTSESVMLGSDRACKLITDIASGAAAKGTIEAGRRDHHDTEVTLRWARLNKLLGVDVPRKKACAILQGLGFEIAQNTDDGLTVSVPKFRRDIEREVDLIEEVARVWGFDNVPDISQMRVALPSSTDIDAVSARSRESMTAASFYEVITPSFVSRENCSATWSNEEPFALGNPIRENESYLRTTLVESVLAALKINEDKGSRKTHFFELARVYLPSKGQQPEEKVILSAVCPADFGLIKGVVQQILDEFNVTVSFQKADIAPYEPGRSARIQLDGGTILAWVGDVSSAIQDRIGLRQPVSAFEIDLEALTRSAVLLKSAPELPRFPAVTRDYAFILDEGVAWSEVECCVSSNVDLVEEVKPFDIFRSPDIGSGKKSVAFSIVFRSHDRTLTREDVDAVQADIIGAAEDALGAVLRA